MPISPATKWNHLLATFYMWMVQQSFSFSSRSIFFLQETVNGSLSLLFSGDLYSYLDNISSFVVFVGLKKVNTLKRTEDLKGKNGSLNIFFFKRRYVWVKTSESSRPPGETPERHVCGAGVVSEDAHWAVCSRSQAPFLTAADAPESAPTVDSCPRELAVQ